VLVRGDFSMAGTCTVTYVDKDNLLACGHPITQFGHVAFPMTKATVLATLPSPLNASKIIATTETVGQFTQDRNAAVLGRFGETARMIPVHIEITGESPGQTPAPRKDIHFEVVDNKDLTPSLVLVSVFQSLQQTNLFSAEGSYRLTGKMTVAGEAPVEMGGVMAPNQLNPAAINTALFLNERFSRVYGNTASQPVITGLELRLTSVGPERSATLERVRVSRDQVRPGDQIEVEATVHPLRSPSVTLRTLVTVPAATSPGDLRLLIGDGASADRVTLPVAANAQAQNTPLRDTIDLLNRGHRNDRLYVTLLTHDAQTALEGGTMGAVPLSMANVFESQKAEQRIQVTGESAVELGSVDTGFALTGSQILTLKVK
jgi:hypothetical protein